MKSMYRKYIMEVDDEYAMRETPVTKPQLEGYIMSVSNSASCPRHLLSST
jgi:hypothetical protein